MTEMIPIQKEEVGGSEVKTVNARDLHLFLESRQEFANWIRNRIGEYGFVDGRDFLTILSKSNGGRPRREFYITLDMAKELSMVERNAKGKQARQYFIECERRAMEMSDPMKALNDPSEMRAILLTYTEKVIELEEEKQINAPKVAFAEAVEKSKSTVEFTEFAKIVSRKGKYIIGRNKLYAFLRDKKILMNGYHSKNQPYQRYIAQGWFELEERTYENSMSNGPRLYTTTLITGKGQIAIEKLLSGHFKKVAA